MSIQLKRIGYCDACDTEVDPDESDELIDMGFGLHHINLCPDDRAKLWEPLETLVRDQGTRDDSRPPVATRPSKPTRSKADPAGSGWAPDCPLCGQQIRGNRTATINHLNRLHGMDRVEASRRVPVPKHLESVECPVCGFIASLGTGLAMHVSTQHGEKEWERIRAQTLGKAH